MPFNPVPLRLEAVAWLLPFPVPLRLGTYGKGYKWMLVVCLWLALSLVLQNTNKLQQRKRVTTCWQRLFFTNLI